MGQFIETQQALVSEAKLKRLEREQKAKDKKRQEEQEKKLFYLLDEKLANAKDIRKEYLKMSSTFTRTDIVESITIDKNDTYVLIRKYNKLLNLAYNSFKEEAKQQEQEKEKELKKRLEKELKGHFEIASNKLTYQYLTQEEIKNAIIDNISNTQEEAEALSNLYYKILNNTYKGYKYNLQQTNKTIQEEKEEEETTHKRSHMFYITLFSCILFVVLIIIHFVAITKILPGIFVLAFLWYKFKSKFKR